MYLLTGLVLTAMVVSVPFALTTNVGADGLSFSLIVGT